jgi:hypothetical protein
VASLISFVPQIWTFLGEKLLTSDNAPNQVEVPHRSWKKSEGSRLISGGPVDVDRRSVLGREAGPKLGGPGSWMLEEPEKQDEPYCKAALQLAIFRNTISSLP